MWKCRRALWLRWFGLKESHVTCKKGRTEQLEQRFRIRTDLFFQASLVQ